MGESLKYESYCMTNNCIIQFQIEICGKPLSEKGKEWNKAARVCKWRHSCSVKGGTGPDIPNETQFGKQQSRINERTRKIWKCEKGIWGKPQTIQYIGYIQLEKRISSKEIAQRLLARAMQECPTSGRLWAGAIESASRPGNHWLLINLMNHDDSWQ